MSGQLSKRQQARHERILQDLIKTVPGNNLCADCQARNPGWASWSLGIFLCMRCAALHRKLGTHISKIKSLSMDSWSYDQVEIMKRVGNVASNRIYNPQNTRAPINFDADGTNSAMERFIRHKYPETAVKSSQISSSRSHDSDDRPPPLPPKSGPKFGICSTSSRMPVTSQYRTGTVSQNDQDYRLDLPKNKPSRVFGIAVEGACDYDTKSAKLYDMGFTNHKMNLMVLKNLEGNLEKSIEALVTQGENDATRPRQRVGPSTSTQEGLSNESTGLIFKSPSHMNTSGNSRNPFDFLDPGTLHALPQSSQSTGALQPTQMNSNLHEQAPAFNSNNLAPSQSSYNLDEGILNMTLTRPPSLFPNRTGPGLNETQASQPVNQQSLTPPVPSLPPQHLNRVPSQNSNKITTETPSYNPFIQTSHSTPLTEYNSSNNFYTNCHQYFPLSHQNSVHNSYFSTDVFTTHQCSSDIVNYSAQQRCGPTNQQQTEANPFVSLKTPQLTSNQPQALLSGIQYPTRTDQRQIKQEQVEFVTPQLSNKVDTRSILDLYNYPHLAPDRPTPEKKELQQQTLDNPNKCSQPDYIQISMPTVTLNNKNPFFSDFNPTSSQIKRGLAPIPSVSSHISQESLNLDTVGWMNGRHSPEAWRSISARPLS